MLKQTFKWIDITLAAILAIGLGVFLGIYAWVSYEPRDMSAHVPELLEQVNERLAEKGYQLTLNKAVIQNDGFKAPLVLKISDVRLSNNQHQVIAKIPAIKLSPSFLAVLKGKPYSGNIEIVGAEFSVLQDAQGAYYLNTQGDVEPLRLDSFLPKQAPTQTVKKSFSINDLFEQGVQQVKISNAKAMFRSELTGFELAISSLSASFNSMLSSQQVRSDIEATFLNSDNKTASLQANILYNYRSKQVETKLFIKQLIAAQFANLDSSLTHLTSLPYAITGNANGVFNLDSKHIDGLGFNLQSPDHANLKIRGKIKGEFDNLGIVAKGELGWFNLAFLKKHWPEGLGIYTQRWITESLSKATVTKAEFNINATPEMLQQSPLPPEALQAVLHIKDARIDYVSGYPKVESADGRVFFKGQSLLAEVDNIKMLTGTRMNSIKNLPKATIKIPDLAASNIKIFIDVPIKAPVKDVIRFLEATPYKLPNNLPIKTNKVTGKMLGVLSMQVIDRRSPIDDDVDFQLEASLHNISHMGLAKAADLSALNGTLKANNNMLKGSFNGQFNKKKFNGSVALKGDTETYNYKGNLPASIIGLFAKDLKQNLSGSLQLNASINRKNDRSVVDIDADTKGLRYTLPIINKVKAASAAGRIEAKGDITKNRLNLSKLVVSDNHLDFTGTLGMNFNTGAVTHSRIDKFAMGNNKAKGSYSLKSGQHHLTLTSPMLNLEALETDDEKQSKSFFQHLADIPNIVANIKLAKVRFEKDKEMSDIVLKANCKKQRCSAFNFSARAGDTPITAQIGDIQGKRNFTASTPNLGKILRATGTFNDFRNGALQINAVYQDELPNRPMAGRVIIEDFNAKNIPLLAKLLTVATFTGILDSISGGGISFSKMEVPFQYDLKKLVIDKAKAVGPSIGITASGSLDVVPDEINVDGVLIPAKLFDTILSDIPIIGNVYQAITSGEGLVAVNYNIKGKFDDAKVKVNPLSALTPGFLRDVFSTGGVASKEKKQDAKDAKEAIKAVEDDLKTMEGETIKPPSKPSNKPVKSKAPSNPRKKPRF